MAAALAERMNGFGAWPVRRDSREDVVARIAPPKPHDAPPSPRNFVELPRSASYTFVGDANRHHYDVQPPSDSHATPPEGDHNAQADEGADFTTPDSSGWTTPEEHVSNQNAHAEHGHDLLLELQRSPKIATQAAVEDGRSSIDSSGRRTRASLESARTVSTVASTPAAATPRRSMTSNFSRKLKRTSWIESTPSSRSPSPKKQENDSIVTVNQDVGPRGTVKSRKKSLIRRKESTKTSKAKTVEQDTPHSSDDQSEKDLARKSTVKKKKARPVSGLFRTLSTVDKRKPRGQACDQNGTPPVPRPPVPKSFSTDRLPMSRSSPHLASTSAAPVPRLLLNERTSAASLSLPRKRDELWTVFRNLDGDYAKFSSKSVALKANVVRSSLLPFLRNYAKHPSNKNLRPEDLDRRSNILNKWWTGLIEMLHGRNNQSISGTDRPAILDGISGVMERPEWRLPLSPFCPLDQRTKGASTPGSRSTTSLGSSTSDFLAESVYHNVRNIFVQNLSAQMAFVVDKMSLRNASASLVTFCGKACAYAFMFVPGMADVLVRLWDLQMDTIRRVLDGNGIGKFDHLDSTATRIVPNFPPALQQLGFTSLIKYMRKLRTPPPLPLGTANIQWWGHWLERWTGRESDLFYVFVKHFHILTTDFLPADTTNDERMCAPGLLLVHAQILTNLEATIHRDASPSQHDPAAAGPSTTFDEVLAEPDAISPALPLPPTNAVRLMVENRLIMLIRDFLSERAAEYPIARRLFAGSINDLLQTAARGTSMFDHAACYTLLDFMEEALILLVRFEDLEEETGLVSASFWNQVCSRMIQSHNTMTEVRLYAFLYTVWTTFASDLDRKADLCFGLLLDPEIFESRFNHWCPMVRAYYMRLLCWRVARHDGEASAGDVRILETLLDRLQATWSLYVYLRQQAEEQQTPLPATTPCLPAPSRRLLIVRTDPQLSHGGANFLGFDGSVPPQSPKTLTSGTAPAWKRVSTVSSIIEIEARPESSRSTSDSEAEPRGRTIGGFFRNLLGPKTRAKSQGPPSRASSALSVTSSISTPPLSHGLTRSATEMQTGRTHASSLDPLTHNKPFSPQHRNFSFKFSLEFLQNAKPLPPMRLAPPRLPLPAHQFLQTHSQKMKSPHHAASLAPAEPTGQSRAHARYAGRALAEWAVILGECQSFFERRRSEGVPANRLVETPTLGVEVFRRPG